VESLISEKKRAYSTGRLDLLASTLTKLDDVQGYPGLTIFAAGSYGRLEASEHSDIDLFFIAGGVAKPPNPRTLQLRLFGSVIRAVDQMGFPEFSNDCEFLQIVPENEMKLHLGSRQDDHSNYFTVRMLMLLEGRCIFGEDTFNRTTASMVESYFKDYPDHSETFLPTFLMNDIHRYWLTLTVNYENKRNLQQDDPQYPTKKLKQKVKNYKLKYSRMTICFATLAALGSFGKPVNKDQVLEVFRLTPRERLESIASRIPALKLSVDGVLQEYDEFLGLTALATDELEAKFKDKQKLTEMFQRANRYVDSMYALIHKLDNEIADLRLLRYLVI
jgi:hypothetical protein